MTTQLYYKSKMYYRFFCAATPQPPKITATIMVGQPRQSYLGLTSSPYVVRIPVSYGSHTVSLSADRALPLLWVAGNSFARQSSTVPTMFAGNMYLADKNPNFYSFINSLNQQIVSTLASDGLNIFYIDLSSACTPAPKKPMVCNAADGVNPGKTGNLTIANTFLTTIHTQ